MGSATSAYGSALECFHLRCFPNSTLNAGFGYLLWIHRQLKHRWAERQLPHPLPFTFRKKGGEFGCDQCEKSFTNKNALQYHVESHRKLKVECDLCGFQSSSKGNLEMHKKIHIAGTKHECDSCDKKFSNKQNLLRHEKEVHYAMNVNVTYVEDLDDAKYIIKCEHCELKSF